MKKVVYDIRIDKNRVVVGTVSALTKRIKQINFRKKPKRRY